MDISPQVYTSDSGITVYYNSSHKIHRTDGPAIIYPDGTQIWYLNGEWHREGGPTVEYPDGSMSYYLDGKLHRTDGPAIIKADGVRQWWLQDQQYSFDNFIKHPILTDEDILIAKLSF